MYPDNMVQVTARMYLYRWNEHTDDNPGNAHYQAGRQEACTCCHLNGSVCNSPC